MSASWLPSRGTLFTLLHLAIWAQLGVLTRIFLDKFFTLGCSGGWGPCLTGSFYFKDLTPNMLGSFIIGLFAASTTIGLANEKSVALLPKDHPWQNNFAVQIGIRTGYCGSLTTFSAWINDLVSAAIKTNSWMNAVLGIIVGLYAAIFSYTIGIHAALYIDRWIISDQEDVLEEEIRYSEMMLEERRQGMEPSLPGTSHGIVADGTGSGSFKLSHRVSLQQERLDKAEYDLPRINVPTTPEKERLAAELGLEATSREFEAEIEEAIKEEEKLEAAAPVPKTDIIAILGLVLLTAWCIVGTVVETRHMWLRQSWVALLFAPIGCYLRWFLSRLNYKFKGKLSWTPAGTFIANMIGTAFSSAMSATQLRGNLDYWGTLVTGAVSLGFCGATSTVSTFVTEIVKFAAVFPDDAHTYSYTLTTILSGVAVVFAVFGWAVWAY